MRRKLDSEWPAPSRASCGKLDDLLASNSNFSSGPRSDSEASVSRKANERHFLWSLQLQIADELICINIQQTEETRRLEIDWNGNCNIQQQVK